MVKTSSGRLWLGAFVAWSAMLAAVAVLFGVMEFFTPGGGDPDIKTPGELTAMVLMFSLLPSMLVAFGVFLPSFAIARRFAADRLTHLHHALIGAALSVPAFCIFVVINWWLQPRRGKTLMQDVAAILHRPSQIPPVVAILAIGGLVFGLTLPARRRVRTPFP